jgi:DNA-binding NarL/FixJ family response regulator
MNNEIRIVIADDHPIVRQGLRQAIETDPELKVVAEAGDGLKAIELIQKLKPEVAILDIDMPHLDGFGAARAILDQGLPVAIIFLTIHSEEELFHAALEMGVKGYMLKDSAVDEIVTGIRAVVAGRRYTSLPLTTDVTQTRSRTNDPLLRAIESLTPTELRILKLLADYQTSKQIADELGISIRTVETHRAHICQKLELKGSHALMKFAVKHKAML